MPALPDYKYTYTLLKNPHPEETDRPTDSTTRKPPTKKVRRRWRRRVEAMKAKRTSAVEAAGRAQELSIVDRLGPPKPKVSAPRHSRHRNTLARAA